MSSQQLRLERHGMATVIDKEVALAAAAQGLAPAGAMPPLMVGMLAKRNDQEMFIGAPTMPHHHARAAPVRTEIRQTPEADAFAISEQERRMKMGGFVEYGRAENGKTRFDMMQIAAIPGTPMAYLGEDAWGMQGAQVPSYMQGLNGRSPMGGEPSMQKQARWQRGEPFPRDNPPAEEPILRPNFARQAAPPVVVPSPDRVVNTASAAGGRSMLSRGHA